MTATDGDCPLDPRTQVRNLVVFAGCTALIYLAAPVGYVGVTQASLCRELGASNAVANLPETAFLASTFAPVVFAWLFPYVSWLRRNLMIAFGAAGVSMAGVAAVLVSPAPDGVKVAAVIAQGALTGAAVPSAIAFLWEALGRGVGERRRGLGLALAFGVGPLFAVPGSLGSQLVLTGKVGPVEMAPLESPANFAVLYAAAAPLMLAAALLGSQLVIPVPTQDAVRQPFVRGVFGGLWGFLKDPVLGMATVVTVLLYTGNTIASNLNLYSQEVFGDAPMLHAGNQNAARFACKTVAGLFLGWLLTRTSPKTGVLVAGGIFVAAVVAALGATAETYLLVFGIFGAGELIGVYAPNYLLAASRKEDMRRNMAFMTMMMVPVAPAGYLFGRIADVGGRAYGPATGFRMSFVACLMLMVGGLLLAVLALPARPRPVGEPAAP